MIARILKTVLLSVSVLSLVTIPGLGQQPVVPGPKLGLKPMINLKLQDLNGKPFDADKLKGKILVVDFWATWCGPCVAEIPALNDLQKKYASKGVEVVGVTMASGEPSEVKPFVGKHNMTYPVVMGDDDQTYDLGIVGYPTTYVVTKDWKVFGTYIGGGPGKAKRLEADLDKLVSGGADTAAAGN
jgi:thiol-disulfide isomerase/thioredoxin